MKICLDAGHGGPDNGTNGNNILEDTWALEFVGRLGHHLRAHGAETVETRKTDKKVALATRAAIAVNADCDLFISIHCNGVKNTSADGAEVFYAPAGPHKNNSIGVGRELLTACVEQGLDNRGVKPDNESQHPSLTVLRNTCQHMPAVLLEIGFVSNKHDASLMKNNVWRDKLAAALALAIVT